jgi:regulator of protease activity HflC (stomatin/prohibitin superfamily)
VQQKLAVYSKDVQGADVLLSVNYAVSPESVGNIYTVGGMDYQARLIQPQLMSKPKDVFGKYNAVNIVQNREKLTQEIYDELTEHFKGTGIIIQSVQVENIDFSDSYERSVEERMKAEVEVQRVQQNLERERINADMVRTKAQGEADAKLARATADAKAIEIQGRAEAEAIRAKAEAMAKNPDYIRMLQAERWDGKLPQTMLPSSSIPIIK